MVCETDLAGGRHLDAQGGVGARQPLERELRHLHAHVRQLLVTHGLGFRVQGSGFRVQGSGFRVQGVGFRVQGVRFMVE